MHQTLQIQLFEVCISSLMVLPEKPKVPGDSSEGHCQTSEEVCFFSFLNADICSMCPNENSVNSVCTLLKLIWDQQWGFTLLSVSLTLRQGKVLYDKVH